MSDLRFSAEAVKAACAAVKWTAADKAQNRGIEPLIERMLDAALAHDTERLSREIIEQRVAAISREAWENLMDDDITFGEWRQMLQP